MAARGLVEGERVVVSVHAHGKALVVPAVLLVLTCASSGFLFAVAPGGDGGRYLRLGVLVVAAAVIVVFTLLPFAAWLSSTYTVTTARLIAASGVLNRSGQEIWLQRVNDVSYQRSVTDRLLGCGTLVVRDASEQGGLRLLDVPRVQELHRTITDLVLRTRPGVPDDASSQGGPTA